MTFLPPETSAPAALSPLMRWLGIAAGLALLSFGLGFIFDPAWMSHRFGVPLASAEDPYLSVAGSRDLFAGALTLVFAMLGDRRALGLTILVGTLVPIGDGLVVLWHSPTPMLFLPLHGGAALASLAVACFTLRGCKFKK